jgi:aspartyl-tRNA(Asn)/glutamyl-tRNA(Gln) amidotransferase subunit C
MKLTIKEVEHIASLARLALTEDEIKRYAMQLSDILDYAARLDALDTSQIPPTASVLESDLVLRADHPKQGLTQKEVLQNAADTKDNQFKVPPVMGDSNG